MECDNSPVTDFERRSNLADAMSGEGGSGWYIFKDPVKHKWIVWDALLWEEVAKYDTFPEAINHDFSD